MLQQGGVPGPLFLGKKSMFAFPLFQSSSAGHCENENLDVLPDSSSLCLFLSVSVGWPSLLNSRPKCKLIDLYVVVPPCRWKGVKINFPSFQIHHFTIAFCTRSWHTSYSCGSLPSRSPRPTVPWALKWISHFRSHARKGMTPQSISLLISVTFIVVWRPVEILFSGR